MDWRYRKSKSGRNEHDFLSPEGEIFKSRKNLVDHFQASNKYTEEDVKNIDLLFEEMNGEASAGPSRASHESGEERAVTDRSITDCIAVLTMAGRVQTEPAAPRGSQVCPGKSDQERGIF